MAFQDILQAIIDEADALIEQLAKDKTAAKKQLEAESADRIAKTKEHIAQQRDEKKRQLKEKAESFARMQKSKMVMAKKQEHINQLFDSVLQQLVAMDAKKTEVFLQKCMDQIHGAGVIHPTKQHENILKKILPEQFTMGSPLKGQGGFMFVGKKEEHNFTYEFLVQQLLRPATEAEAAHLLFS